MNVSSKEWHPHALLTTSTLDTKLGPMIAISSDKSLYLLEFADKPGLSRKIEKLRLNTKASLVPGTSPPLHSIAQELKAYFQGLLKEFKTPFHLLGTPFQHRVWEELLCVPYGHTRSYMAQATALGAQKAYRAVANANGANHLALIIPCHRIIKSTGTLGGYGGGTVRKKWLIEHEKSFYL